MEPKMEFIWAPRAGVKVVAITEFHGSIVIATEEGVYRMSPDYTVTPVEYQHQETPDCFKRSVIPRDGGTITPCAKKCTLCVYAWRCELEEIKPK